MKDRGASTQTICDSDFGASAPERAPQAVWLCREQLRDTLIEWLKEDGVINGRVLQRRQQN